MFYIGFEQDQFSNEYKLHAVADNKQELFGLMDSLTFLSFCGLPATGSSFRKLWLAGFNENREYETPIFPPLPNLSIGPLSTTPIEDFEYRSCECVVDGATVYGAELVSYTGNDPVIVLPRIADGLPIIKIADGFKAENADLKAVTFSGNIAVIGSSAFVGCTELEKVTFNSALREIKNYAFDGCIALNTVCFIGTVNELKDNVTVGFRCGLPALETWEVTSIEEVLGDMNVVVSDTATFPISTVAASKTTTAVIELLNQAFEDEEYAVANKDHVASVLRSLVAHMNQADWHAVFVNYGINPKRAYLCDDCGKEVLLTTAGYTVHGEYLCEHCWEKYKRSEEVLLEFFVGILKKIYDVAIFADQDLIAIKTKVNTLSDSDDFFVTHLGKNKDACMAEFNDLTKKAE